MHGWTCVSHDEAYIVNVVSEVYDYANPDEFRIHPHDNDIPYDWTRKDG
jgi:dTDP-4-dehydrorhamnose 3,5-epimerase